MKKARELGRNLFSMATGGSSEEDREKGLTSRRSWSDVVSSSPPLSSSPSVKPSKEPRTTAGMPRSGAPSGRRESEVASPGKGGSPQRIFSLEDVAKLVEIARKQLRKEQENESGWKEVEARGAKNQEKAFVRDLVEGYRGSPDAQFKCWQCDEPGHKSSDCPKGELCFVCNSPHHKRAECPLKRKATRQEKGKALDLGNTLPQRRLPMGGISIVDARVGEGRSASMHDRQQVRREDAVVQRQ